MDKGCGCAIPIITEDNKLYFECGKTYLWDNCSQSHGKVHQEENGSND
jgi:hypothetical protein